MDDPRGALSMLKLYADLPRGGCGAVAPASAAAAPAPRRPPPPRSVSGKTPSEPPCRAPTLPATGTWCVDNDALCPVEFRADWRPVQRREKNGGHRLRKRKRKTKRRKRRRRKTTKRRKRRRKRSRKTRRRRKSRKKKIICLKKIYFIS